MGSGVGLRCGQQWPETWALVVDRLEMVLLLLVSRLLQVRL